MNRSEKSQTSVMTALIILFSMLFFCVNALYAETTAETTAPAETKTEVAKPAETKETKPAEAPKIKTGGLLQMWYQYDNSGSPEDTFRLRRAEIKLSGDLTPLASWAIMFDPAQVREDDTKKSGSNITDVGRKSVLQDFLISIKPFSFLSFDFGQGKTPFGMEGLESSAKLDLIERASIASQFKWADYRDIGLTIKGDVDVFGVKIQPALGLYNGEGQNKLDANLPMDFAGRLVIKPIKQLHLGAAHYNGRSGSAKTNNIHTGVELKFEWDPVSVYGEYVFGSVGTTNKSAYYATVGCKFLDVLQAVARYDWYDNDTSNSGDAVSDITCGLNYFIEKNAKLQANYIVKLKEGGSITNFSDDVVRANVQVNY